MTFGEFNVLLAAKGCDPKGTGSQLSARCPAHDDRRASLSASIGTKGVVLCCHAGCTIEAVVSSLGLKMADLFDDPGRNGSARTIVAEYEYQAADGEPLFQVVRYAPKDFRQRHKVNDAWVWKMNGVRRVLFRLPQALAAIKAGRPIYVCEGEKDVQAMERAGFTATCNPGGAGKWQASYSETLRGAEVVIIADKDQSGRKHAAAVAGTLHGIAARVKMIEVPDLNGNPCKDAADFFAAGGQAAELDALAQEAPIRTGNRTEPAGTPPHPHAVMPPPASSDFAEVTAWIRGKMLQMVADKETLPTVKNSAFAGQVVEALNRIGRFYFHADLRDFDSAMFFDANRKRLERIRSDAFAAWLSDWVVINRAAGLFRYVLSAVETAALSGALTTGILPESYWAARPEALYLSNGDGQAVRITARSPQLVDNGDDGVLFAAGRTLTAWKMTDPADPFETCALFRNLHSGVTHAKDLLRLWLYSFATMPRSKPPLAAVGEIGSGKTRTLKGIAELYGIPFRAAKVEEQLEPNFWPNVNEGGLFVLDNADSKCRWLADAVAAAATDGCSQRRKLYTNSETVTLRANSWLAMTTANPTFGNDAGLADRLLLVRMERRPEETSDEALTAEILANRDAGLSHIAHTLSTALADTSAISPSLNARHPDFAKFSVRIGRALGRETEAVSALQAAEADKAAFCLENDTIGAALLAFLSKAGQFTGTAAELAPHLVAIDADMDGKLSAKRLSKRLLALWPHLQGVLAKCSKEVDRNHITHFTFRASAGIAGFETDFPQKS